MMKRRLLDEPRCPRTICSRVPKRHPTRWAVRPATLFDLWGRRPCIRCCRKSTPNSPQWYKTCTEGTTYDHRRAVTCAPRESLRQDPPAPPLMMCQPSVASYRTASLATWATASGKTQTTMRSIPARATPLPSLPADQANTVPGRVDTIACQRIQLHGEPENGCRHMSGGGKVLGDVAVSGLKLGRNLAFCSVPQLDESETTCRNRAPALAKLCVCAFTRIRVRTHVHPAECVCNDMSTVVMQTRSTWRRSRTSPAAWTHDPAMKHGHSCISDNSHHQQRGHKRPSDEAWAIMHHQARRHRGSRPRPCPARSSDPGRR